MEDRRAVATRIIRQRIVRNDGGTRQRFLDTVLRNAGEAKICRVIRTPAFSTR